MQKFQNYTACPFSKSLVTQHKKKMPLILYIYRVFIKLFSFFIFGLGSLVMIFGVFSILHLLYRKKQKFIQKARSCVRGSFCLFIHFISFMQGASLVCKDKKTLEKLKSCVIVANHPSLLDVVYLISLVPDATCIVNAYLSHSLVSPIVKGLYILNSKDTKTLLDDCKNCLLSGANLIIFPEGTRTPINGFVPYKRGAATIAIQSGSPIVPIYIGGSQKTGLGKSQSLFLYNRYEKYVYDIKVLPPINSKKYSYKPDPIAARLLTKDIETLLKHN